MSTISDFLDYNKELAISDENGLGDNMVLNTIILGIGSRRIDFGYMNSCLSVRHEDVIDISDTTEHVDNTFGRGKPALLTLKPNARVIGYAAESPAAFTVLDTTHETVSVSGGVRDDCSTDQGF